MHRFYANYVSCFILDIRSRYVVQAALNLLASSKRLGFPSSEDNSHKVTYLADYDILFKG